MLRATPSSAASERYGGSRVPYTRAAAHFDDQELPHVLALILTINTWNRVALPKAKAAGTDERG